MNLSMLQNARPVPVKMLTQALTPMLTQNPPLTQAVAAAIPQAMLMRPGQTTTLHTLPVTLASLPPNAVGMPSAGRIAAAIPISQLAPLLDPSVVGVKKESMQASSVSDPISLNQANMNVESDQTEGKSNLTASAETASESFEYFPNSPQ